MKNLISAFCVFALLCASAAPAQKLAASWQGTLPANAEQHRVVLQIEGKDGGYQVTALHIEFLHDPAKIDSFTYSGSELKIAFNSGGGILVGRLAADGAEITATVTLNQVAMPLTLRRASAETAWQTPFLYQYHHRDVTYLRPAPAEATIPFSPKLAFDYLEEGAAAWTADWKCVACHTNGSYMVVRPLLTQQLGTPSKKMRDFFVASLHEQLAMEPADLRPELDSTQAVYIAAGLAIWDAHVTHRLSVETSQALDLIFRLQRKDGDWTISDDNNPPLESSRYQLATVAARAIGNAPGWLAQQRGKPVEAKIRLLESYLRAEGSLQGDYDRVDLLWADAELPGLISAERKQQIIAQIMSRQHPDGGWSIRNFALPEQWGKGNRAEKLRAEPELNNPPSDGHMTGLAIIALREAGVPAGDPGIQRGVEWLLANQRASGRWYTRSLNRDGWQFITYSGTAYPVLALSLCNALPPQASVLRSSGH